MHRNKLISIDADESEAGRKHVKGGEAAVKGSAGVLVSPEVFHERLACHGRLIFLD